MKKSIVFSILLVIFTTVFANQTYVAKVNKHKITTVEYMQRIKSEYESFALEHGATPSPQEQRILEKQAWDNMIEGYILKDIYNKYKISVSTKETLDTLRFNPPVVISKSTKFTLSNGDFDYDKYEKSLRSNKPENLDWLKSFYYTSYIPYAKLKKQVIAKREIKENEIKKQYTAEQNSVNGTAIIFKNSDYRDAIEISQEEIQNYYRQHISDFEIPASCHLKWVKFPIKADRSDSLTAKSLADSLYRIVKGGRDFSLVASKYSDGIYAKNKGYAGYMELDIFPNDIRSHLERATENEVLPPFYMNGSYYVFKLTEKTVSMVKLMIIQVDVKATKQTNERITNNIKKFREMGSNIGFDLAAREFQYEVFEKDSLTVNNVFLPGIGVSENIIRTSLRMQPGVIFDPIKHDESNSYIVFYVFRNTPRTIKRLSEVSDIIIAELSNSKSGEFVFQKAENWLKMNSNKLVEQARIDNLDTVKLFEFKYDSQINNRKYISFNQEFLSQKRNNTIIVREKDCTIIGIIDSQKEVNMHDYPLYRANIKRRLQQINQDEYFEDFLKKEKAKVKVKDYRKTLNKK